MNTWKPWLHGLGATFIGGVATAVTTMIIDPVQFNLHEGFKHVGEAALVAGLLNACAYLKQSPLPPETTKQS